MNRPHFLPLILLFVFAAGALAGARIVSVSQLPPADSQGERGNFREGNYQVTQVLDGDTIVVSSGEHIRYWGIDAPEKFERWGEAATKFNQATAASLPTFGSGKCSLPRRFSKKATPW